MFAKIAKWTKNEKKMKNEKSVFLREILRESLRLLIIVTSKSTVCGGTIN